MIGTCAVDECGRIGELTRGWCRMHYSRWKRHGDPTITLNATPETCIIDGCDKPAIVNRGWCSTHYSRWHYKGDPMWERPTAEQRFWSKVTKTDTCWPWTGRLYRGYGRFRTATGPRNTVGAHQYAYRLLIGPVPDGLVLDHRCHVPEECVGGSACLHRRCVNPEHLLPVTSLENLGPFRSVPWAARITACRSGHLFDESNSVYRKNGQRRCKTCDLASGRAAYRRSRARDLALVLEAVGSA